jgi:hypothetical protein
MHGSRNVANRIEQIKFSAVGPTSQLSFAQAKPDLDQGMLIRMESIGQSGWTAWAAALYEVVEALYLRAMFSERNTAREGFSGNSDHSERYISSLELAKSGG